MSHPPGASYLASNAMLKVRQKFLRLEPQINICFDDGKWTTGGPMYDWYTRRTKESSPYVETIQLRKETKAPFFHEFIVFSLRGGNYFRIDRRQLPDEQVPLDAIYTDGVTAYDTIEEVPDLNSILYARSKCLAEINFKVDVHVGLILRICRAIQAHESSKVYTLQRYNCYFFAQTLVLCVACGVSDWAGLGALKSGENIGDIPWVAPNVAEFNVKNLHLNNRERRDNFKWHSSETFNHDWGKLSQLSDTLVRASPVLRHADHCNYCLECKSVDRQRSLSSEINRLKDELVEYWNGSYRRLLDKVHYRNHLEFVSTGVWGIVKENQSKEYCEQVIQENLEAIQNAWEDYSRQKFTALVSTTKDLVDPTEHCDAWYPDPDEWRSTWICLDGGPVKAAMQEWEQANKRFFDTEFSHLKQAIEEQAIQCGTQAYEKAMLARIASFEQNMTIKLRVLQDDDELVGLGDATSANHELADQQSIFSERTTFTKRTRKTIKTIFSTKTASFAKRMRHILKRPHKLEEVKITELQNRIGIFINKHGDRVESYRAVLKCSSKEVQNDVRKVMDEVWKEIID